MWKSILWLCLLSNVAQAEPGPTVNWLMKTPTTLFDLGMERLENTIDGAVKYIDAPAKAIVFGSTSYDFSKNEITVQVFMTGDGVQASQESCARWRTNAENLLYPIEPDQKPEEAIASFLDGLFAHAGYQEGTRPSNVGSTLASIVFLEVKIIERGKGKGIVCRGRLGDKPSFRTL